MQNPEKWAAGSPRLFIKSTPRHGGDVRSIGVGPARLPGAPIRRTSSRLHRRLSARPKIGHWCHPHRDWRLHRPASQSPGALSTARPEWWSTIPCTRIPQRWAYCRTHGFAENDFATRIDLAGLHPGPEIHYRVWYESLEHRRATSEPLWGQF